VYQWREEFFIIQDDNFAKICIKIRGKILKKVHILELGFCWPLLVEFYLQNQQIKT
jgi:hypothetical protein